jgi:signal transduction histidine kinase
MKQPSVQTVSEILSFVVHDLRNHAAVLSVNVPFIEEVVNGSDDGSITEDERQDLLDAAADTNQACSSLLMGLEQFGYVAHWIAGKEFIQVDDGDLMAGLRELTSRETRPRLELESTEDRLPVRGANVLVKILDILIANASQHAPPDSTVKISARREGDTVVAELQDKGRAIAQELRPKAFTPEGQPLLKNRSDGRYSRVVGLLAAGILAQTAGAALEADGEDGRAVFRLRAPVIP